MKNPSSKAERERHPDGDRKHNKCFKDNIGQVIVLDNNYI